MQARMQEPTYWILTALTGGRRHGYALINEVDELSSGRVQVKVTTLYAALDRLEREGLVALDGEETVDGRRRRYFVLTAPGAAALTEEALRLQLNAESAAARLRAHGWAPRPSFTTSA